MGLLCFVHFMDTFTIFHLIIIDSLDFNNILDIDKYLMKKHDIK